MQTKILRIVTVFVINTILIYVLSIAAFLIAFAIAGSDPREAGLIMISPLAFMILGMIFVATVGGILNGILINAFWRRFIDGFAPIVKFNAAFGAGVSLLFFVTTYGQQAVREEASFSDIGKVFVLMLIASGTFGLSNILTVFSAKGLFHRHAAE